MRIPDSAMVLPYRETRPGDLLVGRFPGEEANFVAIRAEDDDDARDRRRLVILTPMTLGHTCPYAAVAVDVPAVLDFGSAWFFDVDIDAAQPALIPAAAAAELPVCGKLIRAGDTFYLGLQYRRHKDEETHPLLDTGSGKIVFDLPEDEAALIWPGFAVCLPQPDGRAPVELCRWPDGAAD